MQRMKEDQVFDIKNENEGSFDESCYAQIQEKKMAQALI